MSLLKKILRIFFGGAFVFFGIGTTADSVAIGIIMILIGAVLLLWPTLKTIVTNPESLGAPLAASPVAQPTAKGHFTTKVAGVTFKNENGPSRQRLLSKIYDNGASGEVSLQSYEYNRAPAVKILHNGKCIGNVPQDNVAFVQRIMGAITSAWVTVETFSPNEAPSKTIYRADLHINYNK